MSQIQVLITIAAGILGLAGMAGFVFAQLRKGVIQELRETIATANTEIQIQRGRSDRLEKDLKDLELKFTEITTENRTYYKVITSGEALSPKLEVLLNKQTAEILAKLKK